MNDNDFMGEALRLAGCAAERGEVPVGAVVVCDGQIVGTGFNRRETGKNALAHAELEAIDAACRRVLTHIGPFLLLYHFFSFNSSNLK